MFRPLPTVTGLLRAVAGVAAAVLLTAPAFGQTYFRFRPSSLSSSAGTYTPVSGSGTPVTLNDAGGDPTGLDEGLSSALPIGFSFPYNGQTMTHFVISSNGWIKLGTSAGMTLPTSALFGNSEAATITVNASSIGSTVTANRNTVSPFNTDLNVDAAFIAADNFSYEVTGVSPNQVLTVQWKNTSDYATGPLLGQYATLNFQCKLNQTSGVINFVYGSFTAGPDVEASRAAAIGLRGDGDDQPSVHTLWINKGQATTWAAVVNTPPSSVGATTALTGTNNLGASYRGIAAFAINGVNGFAIRKTVLPVVGQTYTLTPVAPIAPLNFSVFTAENVAGTYTTVVGGSVVVPVNAVPATDYDNGLTPATNIGFTFNYNGIAYTQLRVSTNGIIKLGTAAPSSLSLFGTLIGQGALNSANALDANILAPLNMDLRARAALDAEIRVETVAGVCTIQWRNFRDAATSIYNDVNFQVKLYQTTNTIEYVYGAFTSAGPATAKAAAVGMRGTNDLPSQNIGVNKNASAGAWTLASFSNSILNNSGAGWSLAQRADNVTFRPDAGRTFRFFQASANDLAVTNIYTLGASPQPIGNYQRPGGTVQNVGLNPTVATNATFTAGAPNATSFTMPVPALSPGQIFQFKFLGNSFNPVNSGATTVSVSVPSDDNNGNNSKSIIQNVNGTTYSYKYPGVSSAGGVGFNPGPTGATGQFVARFRAAVPSAINSVTVDFAAPGNQEFKLGIWASLPSGVPGALLYSSPVALFSPAGGGVKTITFCNPPNVFAGNFFVGLRQNLPTNNIGFSFQNESPLRQDSSFWFSGLANPVGFPANTDGYNLGGTNAGDASTGWNATGAASPFRLNIDVTLQVGVLVPNCAIVPSPAPGATFVSKSPILQWGSGGGNTLYYDVYLGTTPVLTGADLKLFETCASSYSPPALNPNILYYWKVVAKNENGSAVGCPTWSFTTAPNPTNDNCPGAILLAVCAPTPTAGFTVNATQSLGTIGSACGGTSNDDVWYTFVANSNAHRILVVPSANLDPVVEVRTAASCGSSTYLTCADAGGTGAQESTNFTGFTVGTQYYIRIYGFGLAGTEGNFTITVQTDGGWTGAVSNSWFSAGNWCDLQVPTTTTTASIRKVPTLPILTADAVVNNLTVDGDAVLTINTGITLDVRNTGTGGGTLAGPTTGGVGYVSGPGTLRMSSAGAQPVQLINGRVRVNNLSLTNTVGGVTVSSAARPEISTFLDFQPGAKMDNLGIVTFQSISGLTARIGDLTAATYTSSTASGLFTVERWINPGAGRWAMIGAPVQNAALSQWSEIAPTLLPKNNASLFWYNETDSTSTYDAASLKRVERDGWKIPVNLVTGINPGGVIRGYRGYLRSSFGKTISVTGTPYTGNVNVPVTFTTIAPGGYDGGGWNLITNPYASTIDWNNVSVPALVNDAVFVFNGAQYQTYVKGGGSALSVSVNGATRYLPSSQAFMIKTGVSTNIQFQENDKTAQAASFIREGDPVNQLRMTLKNAAGVADESVVRFYDGATPGFDYTGDAGKPWADGLNLYTMDRQGLNYTVNSMPEANSGRTVVPVGVEVYANGTYTINISELESFPATLSIRLRDKLNNTLVNPRTQSTYTFGVTSNPATQGKNRFELIFDGAITSNKVSLNASQRLHIWPNPSSTSEKANFAVQGFAPGKARAEVIDVMGRLVQTQNIEVTGSGETIYTIDAGLTSGRYTLRVISGQNAAVSGFTIQ